MISFSHVCKRYAGGKDALNDISFDIGEGEMVFLTGHSGAGKSTLLKLIMQIERATTGQLVIAGRNLGRMRSARVPQHRRQIGVVFQNHSLLFDRSVFDNVALPLQIAGYKPSDCGRRVRAALDKVGLLDKERQMPIALSGGEQQRVGIARAIVNKPPIVLADEPTGNLDPALSAEIMRLFEQFTEVGVTMLIASHDHGLIKRMDKRILALNEGSLVFDGMLPKEPR
ncbi:cell division ATP-binding protein FtsE [Agaribacterium haliotis]|uniref:cell division ATP-binding protein FtsE n=1 Tax=Agaribacterium haliotis TaxID=2013869 RepID=UPI000BB54F4C|nr:cell division ATP-binding protein FtsE [Agaribacterium haliotis]